MEETELEEGEACFDDNDASIDPDTALSYIDQRLQNVLGHFQKDFEGGMSAEILGPKFGGYGSFLPSHKQVPTVHSHIKTPQTVQNFNKTCLEGAPVNSIIPTKPVLAVRPPATSSFHVSKNETTTSNSANPSEQRSLKVRIKVGSDKSARKNAAIYSGLGLSSPSSSMGNDHHDHEDSDCPLTESHHIPLDSPDTILRDMTSIIVPGNRLLSPLNESLLCLKKIERSIEKKPTPPVIGRKIGLSSFVNDSSSILEEGKLVEGKEVSSQDKSEMKGMKYNESRGFEGDKAPFSGKESFESKQCSTNDLKVNLSSKSALCKENGAAKKDVPVKKRETNKEWFKDCKESGEACGQDHDVIHSSSEETKTKKFSLDTKGSDRTKGKTVHSVCKNDPREKNVEKKVGVKAMTHEPHEVKVTHSITKLPLERKSKLMGIIQTGAMKDNKSAQKDIVKVRNSYKDILDMRVNDDNTQRQEERHIPVNGLPAESAIQVAPAAPSDNWVGCDRCEKWRLLPIGIEPENLPDKWLCSMTSWLPGRNSCDISEDETTRAVQEMNIHLMSQNQNTLQYNGSGAISGLASDNIRHSDHTNSNVNSEAMPLKKNNSRPEGISHLSQKRKSLSEANQPLIEKNMVNKSNNFAMGRHAAEVNGKDVNEGGDLKPKKLKSKTGSNLYDHVTSSNLKTEAAPNTDGYKDNLVISVKRQTESTELAMKSKLLGTEKVEMHAKKRKLKDWEESQPSEGNNDRIGRKEKRLKSSNTEINDSTAIKDNDRSTLNGKTMKIILPGSKENSVDKKQDKHREKVTSRKNLELAATSSSSKVSDSCRRVSLQKGSPVGSVSSSPIRALNHANLSPSVRTISRKSGKGTQIPRKLLPREDNTKGISVIDASQRFGGKVELKQKEVFKIMEDNANDAMVPQISGKESLPKSREKDKKCSFQRVKVKGSEPLTELTKQEPFPNKMRKVDVDVDRCRSSMNPEYSNTKISNDDKDIFGKKISRKRTGGIIGDEKEKPTSLMMSHGGSEAKLGAIGSSEVKKDPKKVFLGDISKKRDLNEVEKKVEGGNLNVKSVVNDCGTMRDLGVIGFVKEYASSQTALTAFKRAEESKDYADRIKISGFDYECNDAYFDSALKFLYAASLLEACSIDFSKSKGVDPVNIYTTSAKLSKNCAQEYEKQKEMAAAALAYKCMEVAYMRIVYCKSSVTRQDLQTSLQMVNQGESPSSSASDVDNLNNQATMDKSVLSNKSIAHPGHHLVARNQANFLRLLDFTGDVNLAMEASTNTQNSYKAAATSITQESPNKEIMISIKKVIEFSFQDVKELVFLVQNAREAINRQGFKGKNIKNRE